jgi:putative inorganic carbon (hco3(-)) transporter
MRLHGDTSMFFHPNSLAGVSLGVVPFVYFLYPVVRRKALKLALLGLAVAALGCVLYSGSRAAYLAVFVFLAYVFASSRRKGRLAAAGIVAIGLSLPFVPAQYKMRFQTLLTGQDIEGRSMERRKEILFDGLHVLKEHPLGVGIAAFPTVRMRLFGRKQDTHNLYLEVATNLGVQGLVIFLLLIRKMLKTFSAARLSFDAQIRRLQDSLKIRAPARENLGVFRDHLEDLRLLRAASLAGTGYIVIRLALGMFGMDTYEIYWWIGSGLAIALFNMNIRSVRLTERLLEAPPPVALAQGKP